MRVLPITIQYKQWNCTVLISHYTTNNRTAIALNDAKDGMPIASLSVNLVDEPVQEGEVVIDTNNCGQEAVQILMEAGIIGEQLRTAQSGFCTYPVHKLLV